MDMVVEGMFEEDRAEEDTQMVEEDMPMIEEDKVMVDKLMGMRDMKREL